MLIISIYSSVSVIVDAFFRTPHYRHHLLTMFKNYQFLHANATEVQEFLLNINKNVSYDSKISHKRI